MRSPDLSIKKKKMLLFYPKPVSSLFRPRPSRRVLPTDRAALVCPLKSHLGIPNTPTSSVRGQDRGHKSSDCCDLSVSGTPRPAQTPPGSGWRQGLGYGWRLRIRDLPNVRSRVQTARSPLCLGPGLRRRPHCPAACSRHLPLVGGRGTHVCERPSRRAAPGIEPVAPGPECRWTSTTRLREAPGDTHRRRSQRLDVRGQSGAERGFPSRTHTGATPRLRGGARPPDTAREQGATLLAPCRGDGRPRTPPPHKATTQATARAAEAEQSRSAPQPAGAPATPAGGARQSREVTELREAPRRGTPRDPLCFSPAARGSSHLPSLPGAQTSWGRRQHRPRCTRDLVQATETPPSGAPTASGEPTASGAPTAATSFADPARPSQQACLPLPR